MILRSHAHISRSAFDVNFEDKYELLAYCLEERKAEFDHFIRNHSPEESLSALLEAIQKESHFFYHVFSAGFNDKLGRIFYRFFNQYFMELLREKECQGAVLPGPAEMVSSFYLGGLTLMILQWIKSNYKLPKVKIGILPGSINQTNYFFMTSVSSRRTEIIDIAFFSTLFIINPAKSHA